jgi:beta-xylosidase
MKIWLIRKIERAEIELKYLKALLIMLSHVEKADDYSDSDSDGDSIKASDIKLVEVDTDSDEDDE